MSPEGVGGFAATFQPGDIWLARCLRSNFVHPMHLEIRQLVATLRIGVHVTMVDGAELSLVNPIDTVGMRLSDD